MAYWTAAQLEPNRERFALHMLVRENFIVYAPRLRERRIIRGRREECETPLFPGYVFIQIVLQWSRARWCPGITRLVMDGIQPAKVSDAVIEEIRGRERNGAIELPKPRRFKPGDQVRVISGPFGGHIGLYAGMKSHERVAVLLRLLGGQQRTELPADAIELIK